MYFHWFFVIFDHFWWFPMSPILLTWPVWVPLLPARHAPHPYYERFVYVATPSAYVRVACMDGMNVFVKQIKLKNHQKSWIFMDLHWFSLIFVIFGLFWLFLMRPILLTWPAPTRMMHHPSSQIDPRSETSKAQAFMCHWGHDKTSSNNKTMKLCKFWDFHDFIFFDILFYMIFPH